MNETPVAYIPKIICAECGKPVADVMRLSDGKTRWIRARCHGKEARVGFSDKTDQTVTLWEKNK